MRPLRLFVAINFPPAMREAMWTATAPLRRTEVPVRWVAAAQLHLTLKFLGTIEERKREELEAGLRQTACSFPSMSLRVGGVGAFPSLKKPRVVWLGVQGSSILGRLQNAVEGISEGLGVPGERRGFHPHVTLGRARRGVRPAAFSGFEAAARQVRYEAESEVSRVDLMRSELGRAGARYSVLSSFTLAGA